MNCKEQALFFFIRERSMHVENESVELTVRDENGDVKGEVAVRYPSNSFKSKEKPANQPVKKVAHGTAVLRRKSFKERITDWLFVNEEDYEDYVYEDIVRPAILDAIGDISHNAIEAVRDTIDIVLFGSVKGARRRRSGYYRTSYDDDYWDRSRRSCRRERDRDEDDRRFSRRSDDVAAKVESRSEAVDLVQAMQERVHDYKVASVLNFYDMADMPTRSTDDDYGWDLGHPFEATITRTRDGYIVEPNKPVYLDR